MMDYKRKKGEFKNSYKTLRLFESPAFDPACTCSGFCRQAGRGMLFLFKLIMNMVWDVDDHDPMLALKLAAEQVCGVGVQG